MKKISVVIPNYNNDKYLGRCLESILKQNYENKEIIIVDDGSNDDSLAIVKGTIKENPKLNIQLICQNNLNAAIARNRGIDAASGDYILFLDSDDMLEDDIVECMIRKKEETKADLIIGNYKKIDENDIIIGEEILVDKNVVLSARREYEKLINIDPVPSNKLYDLKIIKKNNLEWGNVKIGQDLDFYLKYLLLCKEVAMINSCIYKYRISESSMSRTYDWKIFDIVGVFDDIRKFYARNEGSKLHDSCIPVLALKHYEIQMTKQKYYENRAVRDIIVRFFAINERKLDYSLCNKSSADYKRTIRRFRLKCFFRPLFTSVLYSKLMTKRLRRV